MEFNIITFLWINTVLVFASILQMATGVSIGMIIVPILAMISYSLVPVPIILASLTLTIMMAYKGRAHIDKENVYKISYGMISGIFIAVYFFSKVKYEYLGLIFGGLILFSVFLSIKIKDFKLNSTMNFAGGLVAGVMGSMAAVGGQIIALLFQNHKLESIRASLAFLYTFSKKLSIMVYTLSDFYNCEYLLNIEHVTGS